MEKFHREEVTDTPPQVFEELAAQRRRLEEARERFGDYVSPLDLPAEARGR